MKLDLEGNRRGEPERKQTVHELPIVSGNCKNFYTPIENCVFM